MFRSKFFKKPVVLSFLFFLAVTSKAQYWDGEIGNFTQHDIDLKECPFDKESDAVIISDLAHSNYNDEYNLITERRIKFKVLKEKGIDRGNIRIRYYSLDQFEHISNIKAIVLNLDDKGSAIRTNLQPKNIYKKQLNKLTSEVSFALPNIKVGSIVEYQYTSTMKHYGGLRDWYFQSDVPAMQSSYKLYIIPNAEFAYSVYKSQGLHVDIKPDNQNGSVYFEMKNIPGLRDEAYMASERDYLQRVSFQLAGVGSFLGKQKYSTTWKELAKELMEHREFGSQINKDLPGIDEVKTLWSNAPTALDKMKKIYGYVRSNFIWNHVYSIYSDKGIKDVWEKKSGYSGDINLILINLLKSADLEVYPLLVSERQNGKIDTTYPFIDQFNKVAAYVIIDGKNYVLDATDQKAPAHLVPFNLLNTTGFIVDKRKNSLIKITDERSKNLNVVNVRAALDKEGMIAASALVTSYDYGKLDKINQYKTDKHKYEQDLLKPNENIKLDTFTVKGADSDSLPMHHELKMNYSLNKSGEYYLLNYNLFTGFDKNPFISDNRFTNIDFGTKYACIFKETVSLPSNLEPESVPKNIRLVTPNQTMSVMREIKKVDNELEIGLSININKSEYTPEEYDLVKGFYKQLFELLNEPIVLKAK